MRMLTELAEYGHKIKGEMKAMKSEIKGNKQGMNSDGKETCLLYTSDAADDRYVV